MRIGDLATACGVPSRTIRYYERRGLLAEPIRAANGYRTYDHTAIERLEFIRKAQSAGLTLAEVARIIDIYDQGATPCTHVIDLLDAKLAAVRQRIEQLTGLERELRGLVQRGRLLKPADCTDGEICHILQPASR
ncbi:MAG: heavy metal-responsive transcriptional regulator [Acidimicrobiia bacterium]|nr:heavy metal-responsive transcriptional regulator [Acidimicrobiia bacterium]